MSTKICVFFFLLGLKLNLPFNIYTQNKMTDQVPTLHQALSAKYRSNCHWLLNHLTTGLRRLSSTTCGLEFLIRCHHSNVVPRFASAAVTFSQRGPCLCRLAGKLPRQILLASIRDQWRSLVTIQGEVDSLWRRLGLLVSDAALWDRLIEQKDGFFFCCCQKTTLRLRKKFSQLFHSRRRPDSSYFYQSPVDNGPIPALDLPPNCAVHDIRTLSEFSQQSE